jgi:hypothetical protein
MVFLVHLFIRYQLIEEVFNNYEAGSFIKFDFISLFLNFFRLIARTFLPPFVSSARFLFLFLFLTSIILSLLLRNKPLKADYSFRLLAAFWLLSYLPYLSLGIDTHGLEGERYLYLPSVFFSILVVYFLREIVTKNTRVMAFVFIFAFNLFYLTKSRSSYERSSLITKSTINEIGKLTDKQQIFIENLPQYNRGAVVFRLGLEEGIKWLVPAAVGKVRVVSIDDSDIKIREQPTATFQVKYTKAKDTIPVKLILQRAGSGRKIEQRQAPIFYVYNPAADAKLVFYKNHLIVEK